MTSIPQQEKDLHIIQEIKSFSLNHLKIIEKQHQLQIDQLNQTIEKLTSQKENLEKRLQSMRREYSQTKESEKNFRAELERIKKEMITDSKIEKNSCGEEYLIKMLYQAPIRIVKFLKNLPADELPPRTSSSAIGNLGVVILSNDNMSLSKYEGINEKFISHVVKNWKDNYKLVLVHNPH